MSCKRDGAVEVADLQRVEQRAGRGAVRADAQAVAVDDEVEIGREVEADAQIRAAGLEAGARHRRNVVELRRDVAAVGIDVTVDVVGGDALTTNQSWPFGADWLSTLTPSSVDPAADHVGGVADRGGRDAGDALELERPGVRRCSPHW